MYVSEVSEDSVYEHWFYGISDEAREWLIQVGLIVKDIKGIQFKYSSFVNHTSALNVSTTEEELPFKVKNQSIADGIHLKSKSS